MIGEAFGGTTRSLAGPLPFGLHELGPFRLERALGEGGMGRVFLARDEEEGRTVAVKVLRPELVRRRGFFARFAREAQAGSRVDHPNVVRTLECGLQIVGADTLCYLVMEVAEGRTLRDVMRGTLDDADRGSETQARRIAHDVAAGLTAIHAAGIVHRDIKPENLNVAPDGRVRIMDLGVAKDLTASRALTAAWQFAGSLWYAAPEQFSGGPIGPWTDLYALGVVLHEFLSGANPFARSSPGAVSSAHLNEPPPLLTYVRDDVSPRFAQLVERLLAKHSDQRFTSAQGVLESLL